ncbi:MAG: twin-arginine translocase TatA/TatE family subunit [Planctomycetes bacterium]|nr:twin-arginine translocase TatA/TatE family subunit [Planctomycetota bacterium]
MGLHAWEIIMILIVVLLLFGSTQIPKLARGLGAGVKEFKKGMAEGMPEEKKAEEPKKS